MEYLYWIMLILGGFLFGSVMFSQLIPNLFLKKDIYKISVDNNPGGFNVCKHCGMGIGALCVFLDGFKGLVPVLIASLTMDTGSPLFILVMIAPMLGHAIGLFNHFHGGKCVSTSFGIMLGLIPVSYVPIVMLAALFIGFTVFKIIKNGAKRSIVVYVLFLILSCPYLVIANLPFAAIGCGLVSVIPIVKFIFSKNGMVDNVYKESVAECR